MKGVDIGGRLSGTKRRQKKNFKPHWQEYRGRLRGGGYLERALHSRIQREVGWKDGMSEFWDGDGRLPGRRMNSCVRQICLDGDGVLPGGSMN